jgi:hypothetical protein
MVILVGMSCHAEQLKPPPSDGQDKKEEGDAVAEG